VAGQSVARLKPVLKQAAEQRSSLANATMQLRMSAGRQHANSRGADGRSCAVVGDLTIAVKSEMGRSPRRRPDPTRAPRVPSARVKRAESPCRTHRDNAQAAHRFGFLFLDCFLHEAAQLSDNPRRLARSFTCGVRFIHGWVAKRKIRA